VRENFVTTYNPQPINTSGVELDASLYDLIEHLAESNHDNWALQRIHDGWTCGPVRNDQVKHHPDLVPYGELPELEKDYDRRSVIETLKAIVALGYEIRRT
jgi:RyR domain-containing protein